MSTSKISARQTHKIQHLLCIELCLYKFMGVCLLSRLCMCGDVDVWARISDENETFVSIVWEKGEKTPPNWSRQTKLPRILGKNLKLIQNWLYRGKNNTISKKF